MRRIPPLAALAALVLALAGCGGGEEVGAFPETVVGTVKEQPAGGSAGKALFVSQGCGGCHTFKAAGTAGTVGPDLDKVVADAQKAGQPVEDYVRESILDPDKYVAPGFPQGVMPPFEGKLTDSQVDELVSFLTGSGS